MHRLVAFFVSLAFNKKAAALECHRALILGSAGDAEAVGWVSQHCAAANAVDVTPPTVDLIDALCSSQVIIADESDALVALVALCPHELVLLLNHRHNLGLRVDDSTAVALGYTPCDIDAKLKCWRLANGQDPSHKKISMVEAVPPETTGSATSAANPSGFELGMVLATRLSLSDAGCEAFALQLAVRIRIDAATERHAVVPRSSFGSLDTMRVYIEVIREAYTFKPLFSSSLSLPEHLIRPCRLGRARTWSNWRSACSTTRRLSSFRFPGKVARPLGSRWRLLRLHRGSPPLATGPRPCLPKRFVAASLG